MVKNEIQGIIFKYQMSSMYGNQTNWNARPAPQVNDGIMNQAGGHIQWNNPRLPQSVNNATVNLPNSQNYWSSPPPTPASNEGMNEPGHSKWN